jgi:Transposase, Mutator family
LQRVRLGDDDDVVRCRQDPHNGKLCGEERQKVVGQSRRRSYGVGNLIWRLTAASSSQLHQKRGRIRNPQAVNAAFPQTLVQTCIVHLLRNSLAFVSWADRREVVAALKPI